MDLQKDLSSFTIGNLNQMLDVHVQKKEKVFSRFVNLRIPGLLTLRRRAINRGEYTRQVDVMPAEEIREYLLRTKKYIAIE
jgi:hypothetical protein